MSRRLCDVFAQRPRRRLERCVLPKARIILTGLHLTFCSTSLLILSSWVLPVEVRYLICDCINISLLFLATHIQSLQCRARAYTSRTHREQNSASPHACLSFLGSLPKYQQAPQCTENGEPYCRWSAHSLATGRVLSVAARTETGISRCADASNLNYAHAPSLESGLCLAEICLTISWQALEEFDASSFV